MIIKNFVDTSVSVKDLCIIATNAFSGSEDESLDNWFSFDVMVETIHSRRGHCSVAFDSNNKPTGFIYAQQENPINGREGTEKWVIVITAIHPDYAGKGIGTALLGDIEQVAKEHSAQKLFVYTNENDKDVIAFYEKNGYTNAGRIQDYQYGVDNSPVFLLKHLV